MTPHVDRILARLRTAEEEFARELDQQQERWRYRLHRNRVRFDWEVTQAHTRLKQGLLQFVRQGSLRNLITAPIIYSMVVPLALLDLWLSVYQWVCFPLYGIPRVPRARYIVIDRHKLGYLNIIEKGNCLYCSYANGLIGYVREVAGRTEQYWCPIKHARRVPSPHPHYPLFVDYGDAEGYKRALPRLRQAIRRSNDDAAVDPVRATRKD